MTQALLTGAAGDSASDPHAGLVVFAIGGNALAPPGETGADQQRRRARGVAASIVDLAAAGHGVLVVHGNGPQIGALALAQEAIAGDLPTQPLDVLGAMTQGQLGYLLAAAIGDAQVARGGERRASAVMTQVVVDSGDPAFATPTKPIGPFFSEGRARRMADARGWSVAEDSGRGWRRVVPSPLPTEIIEGREIGRLLAEGEIVVACGGGGVPVTRRGGELAGVEAVIDKDASAALAGDLVGAVTLLLLTGVERVMLDFGTPTERAVDEMTVAEARAHMADGQFPAGSMGPKVGAAMRFVAGGGRTAIITSLERGADALAGGTGTRIVP